MKYKILVIRALWVIIALLMDIVYRRDSEDGVTVLSLIIAKRYMTDLERYADIHE